MKRCCVRLANTARQNPCARSLSFAVNSSICFTCEYCLSHYLAMGVLLISHYKLLFSDWRGYFVAFFALVWVANLYMSAYNRLRLDIKHEQVEIKKDEEKVDNKKAARAHG